MRHFILGAGGVGGLIGAVLAQAGEDVTLIVRPEKLAGYPRQLELDSTFGKLAVPVAVVAGAREPVDVLWVSVKATQLEEALKSVIKGLPIGAVVPLLNGVDHVAWLRRRFGKKVVVPATFAGESEVVAPGRIVHRSPFARLNAASSGKERLAGTLDQLTAFGFVCKFVDDEATLMWSKLVMLAPFALSTTAARAPLGEVLADPARAALAEACVRETCAVAIKSGAQVDVDTVLKTVRAFPKDMRSSMQKDVAAGRPPELDAIAGPILRGGKAHKIDVSATRSLVQAIEGNRR